MDTSQLRANLRALADFYHAADSLSPEEAQQQHPPLTSAVGESFKPFYDAAFAGELTWDEIVSIVSLKEEVDAGFVAFECTHPERPQL